MNKEKLTFNLTIDERDFLLESVGFYLEDDTIRHLRIAELKDDELVISMTADDIDFLLGFIAAETNHAEDAVYRERLEAIYHRVQQMTGV